MKSPVYLSGHRVGCVINDPAQKLPWRWHFDVRADFEQAGAALTLEAAKEACRSAATFAVRSAQVRRAA